MFPRREKAPSQGIALAVSCGWVALFLIESVRLLVGGWPSSWDAIYEILRTLGVSLVFTGTHLVVRSRQPVLARTSGLFGAAMWLNFLASLAWQAPALRTLSIGLWAISYLAVFVTVFMDQPEVLQAKESRILRLDTFLAMSATVVSFWHVASRSAHVDLDDASHQVQLVFAVLDLVIFWGTIFRLVTIRHPSFAWLFRWRCLGMLLLACADFSQAAHLFWGVPALPVKLFYLLAEGCVLFSFLHFSHRPFEQGHGGRHDGALRSLNPVLSSGILAVLSVLVTFWILAGKHVMQMGHWVALSLGGLLAAMVVRLAFTTVAFLNTSRALEGKILQLEEASRRAEQLQARALDASRAKSLFLARMSHEIRTPLNAILGYSQLLRSDPRAHADGLAAIQRSGEHLLSLLNDVLEMSRIEAGKTELHLEDFDLEAVLDALDSMFRLRAAEGGLEFRIVRGGGIGRMWRGDQGKLRQILTNLLGNSMKFTSAGSVVLRVGEEVPGLVFDVEDTGCGLSREEQADLFLPFEQRAGGVREGGSGLGLSISRELAQAMGGSLELVRSAPGQGSLFRLFVPMEPSLASVDSSLLSGPLGEEGARILVVDDQPTNRALLRDFLEGLGMEVKEAVDGLDGLEVASAWLPDVVLLDMQMPRMNGVELARELRKRFPASLGIVALTAGVFSEDRETLLAAGADAFLGKPFRLNDVRRTIETLLARS